MRSSDSSNGLVMGGGGTTKVVNAGFFDKSVSADSAMIHVEKVCTHQKLNSMWDRVNKMAAFYTK